MWMRWILFGFGFGLLLAFWIALTFPVPADTLDVWNWDKLTRYR